MPRWCYNADFMTTADCLWFLCWCCIFGFYRSGSATVFIYHTDFIPCRYDVFLIWRWVPVTVAASASMILPRTAVVERTVLYFGFRWMSVAELQFPIIAATDDVIVMIKTPFLTVVVCCPSAVLYFLPLVDVTTSAVEMLQPIYLLVTVCCSSLVVSLFTLSSLTVASLFIWPQI